VVSGEEKLHRVLTYSGSNNPTLVPGVGKKKGGPWAAFPRIVASGEVRLKTSEEYGW
jgi:hypothetical protein